MREGIRDMKEEEKGRELPYFFFHRITTARNGNLRHINPNYTIIINVFGNESRMSLSLNSPDSIL